jgi:hypothetical protein
MRGGGTSSAWCVRLTAAVLLTGAIAAAPSASFSFAAGPAGGDVRYTGVRAHVSAAGLVDFAQLARLDRLNKHAAGPITPAPMPEPQEKAEPNNRITLPSPFQAPLAPTAATSSAPSPSPAAGFLAQADAPSLGTGTSFVPPDTHGAVGLDKLMVPLNSNYVIQQKSNGAVLGTVSMTTFWGATGAAHPFDPKVVYDPYNNRWIVTAVNDPQLATASILYGISDTSDPQGTWHLYSLDADGADTTWADFPTIGFNQNAVAIGVNIFANASSTYVKGKLLVLDYAALRANSGAGNPYTINAPGSFTIQPAITYSATESTLYLVEHGSSAGGTYNFWTLTGLGPPSLSLVGGAAKTNPLGPWTIPGSANVLPQNGGSPADVGDARIGNVVFRNGHVYYAQTIGLPAGLVPGTEARTAVQWVELDIAGNFVQGGRIGDSAATTTNGGHWYGFPSLSVNAANDVLVGFSEFQSNDFPDAGYAFRAGFDPPSTMRDPVTLKEGEGPYYKTFGGGRNRWGDYSNTQVDPSDDTSIWTVQEYSGAPTGSGDDSGRWSTWWGKVDGLAAAPPPPPPPPPPPLTPPKCVVPNVIGRRASVAKTKIRAKHCRVGKLTYAKSTARRKGRVVLEKPAAGKRLRNGTKISLWIGRGPRR